MAGDTHDPTFHTNPNLDPFQGFDIKVSTVSGLTTTQNAGATPSNGSSGGLLVGAFTSAMFKVVNQTETYLPLNSRLPKHLDGEIVIVYALEQGMIDPQVIQNTFGSNFETALNLGRGFKIPRSQRFDIKFEAKAGPDGSDASIDDPAIFYNKNFVTLDTNGNSLVFRLLQCRVDTFSFGMTAGRHIVANSWQGTAEGLSVDFASPTQSL